MTSPDSTYSSTMGTQPADTSRNGDHSPFENNQAGLRNEAARNVIHLIGDAAGSPSPDPTADEVADAKARVADAIEVADEMFSHSAVLEHIAAWADARGSSRVAVLAQLLMRATLAISPRVVLPASAATAWG